MSKDTLTAQALKNILFKTMKDIRKRKIKAPEANAIASQSREIMRVLRTEIEISQMNGIKPVKSLPGFVKQSKSKTIDVSKGQGPSK